MLDDKISGAARPANAGPVGLILAGGRALRMQAGAAGDTDKAHVAIGGVTMLDRVMARLGPQCSRLLINTNRGPDNRDRLAPPLLPDPADVPAFAGPLAGVLAGLDWLAAHAPGETSLVTASVDAPFLPNDLVSRLEQARKESARPVAVARSKGRMHPVFASWDVRLRDELRDAVTTGGLRRIGLWMTDHAAAGVEWTSEPFDPFFNVNTPLDVEEAERIAARYRLS